MANTISQIETSQGTFNLKDTGAARNTDFSSTTHVHTVSGMLKNYSDGGTIGTINTTNNSTTTAIQLTSWGCVGYYTGYYKNKTTLSVSSTGGFTNTPIYTITVTAARPGKNGMLFGSGTHLIVSALTNGTISARATNGTNAGRTVGVGGIGTSIHGNVILDYGQINLKNGLSTSAPTT